MKFALFSLIFLLSSSETHAILPSGLELTDFSLDSPTRKPSGPIRTLWEPSSSAENSAVPISQVNFEGVPELGSDLEVLNAFTKFRDQRYSELNSGFLRRAHWLYPDDGCYSKAALGARLLQEFQYPAPAKIFIFGDLSVASPFSSPTSYQHKTYWWYHVVIAYRVGEKVWILDPTTNTNAPMLVADWLTATHATADTASTIAVCGWGTYVPRSACKNAYPLTKGQALDVVEYFLSSEWSRLENLNLNPYDLLGDKPPWLDTHSN